MSSDRERSLPILRHLLESSVRHGSQPATFGAERTQSSVPGARPLQVPTRRHALDDERGAAEDGASLKGGVDRFGLLERGGEGEDRANQPCGREVERMRELLLGCARPGGGAGRLAARFLGPATIARSARPVKREELFRSSPRRPNARRRNASSRW